MGRVRQQQIAATLEKEAAAFDLWSAGASTERIARQLGYANRSGAWKAIQRAISRVPLATIEQTRERLLNLAYAELQAIVSASLDPKAKNQLWAQDRVKMWMEEIAKLTGAYMPQPKTERDPLADIPVRFTLSMPRQIPHIEDEPFTDAETRLLEAPEDEEDEP